MRAAAGNNSEHLFADDTETVFDTSPIAGVETLLLPLGAPVVDSLPNFKQLDLP